MELIAKISKGSKMDQIYLPKNRIGLATGQYVLVSQLNNIIKKEKEFRPFFYNLKDIAPIKLQIIKQIFINLEALNPENIIITGSFLEQGFHFNDIDIILITKNKPEIREIQKNLESQLKIKIHLLVLNNKSLTEGLSKDPLYEMMLSKCVSKERLIYNAERDIDYKILDYQLLKSKSLIDNFDILNGNEKYYFLLNMFSILLFIQGKKLNKSLIEKEIENEFNIQIEKIKENLIDKGKFIKTYSSLYKKTFNLIMSQIK